MAIIIVHQLNNQYLYLLKYIVFIFTLSIKKNIYIIRIKINCYNNIYKFVVKIDH